MKKVIVILLSLQFLTNHTFAEELLRFPRLFTHYYHHSHEHKDTRDFFDFLHKHYSDHAEKDAHPEKHTDEDDDCKLPFKHCGDCCLHIHSPAIGFVPAILTADFTYYPIKGKGFSAQDDRIESFDFCTIWQPPKIS